MANSYPSAGAVLKSVTFVFGAIKVYTTRSPQIETPYGTLYLSQSDSVVSESVPLSGASSSILSFTGGSMTMTVSSSASDTTNILNIRSGSAITILVEWEARTASTGSLSSTQGMHGKTITLSISAVDSSFTHTVTWTRGSGYSTTQTIAAGVTSATLTVPSSWPVGSATVSLSTFLNGSQVGSTQSYSWTVVVDGAVTFPTAGTLSAVRINAGLPTNWSVYVQGYSSVRLTLSGYSAGTSATISKIDFSAGSQQQSGTSATFTTENFMETGSLTIVNGYPQGNALAVMDHRELHALKLASNHGDILHWLKLYGLTMNDYRAAVQEAMNEGVEVEYIDCDSSQDITLPPLFTGVVTPTGSYLNIRASKSINSTSLWKLYKGDKVEVLDDADPVWWRVRYAGDVVGYAMTGKDGAVWLTKYEAPQNTPEKPPEVPVQHESTWTVTVHGLSKDAAQKLAEMLTEGYPGASWECVETVE